MKYFLLAFLAVGAFTIGACNKDCPDVTLAAPATEVQALETYIESKGITASKDSRGFYYKITDAGTTTKPTVCNNVTVKYTGWLTNGTKFDENTTGANFALSSLIKGWQEGIPLIGNKGKITLYIPPTLGYGSGGSGSIPGNSILIFDIELVDF